MPYLHLPVTDPVALNQAANAAGLQYVSDRSPGITRIRLPNGFAYRYPDGRKITDGRR
jgi:DNA topoisomerase I